MVAPFPVSDGTGTFLETHLLNKRFLNAENQDIDKVTMKEKSSVSGLRLNCNKSNNLPRFKPISHLGYP